MRLHYYLGNKKMSNNYIKTIITRYAPHNDIFNGKLFDVIVELNQQLYEWEKLGWFDIIVEYRSEGEWEGAHFYFYGTRLKTDAELKIQEDNKKLKKKKKAEQRSKRLEEERKLYQTLKLKFENK